MSIDVHIQSSAPANIVEFEGIARDMLGELLDVEKSIDLAICSFNPRTRVYGSPAARFDLEPEVSRIWLKDLVSVDVMVIQHVPRHEKSDFLIALPPRRTALAVVLAVCAAEALARLTGATSIDDEGLLSHSSRELAPGEFMALLCAAQQGNLLRTARGEYLENAGT